MSTMRSSSSSRRSRPSPRIPVGRSFWRSSRRSRCRCSPRRRSQSKTARRSLPQIQQQGQSERNAYSEHSQSGNPPFGAEAAALERDKNEYDGGGYKYVGREECADAIGKQLPEEKRNVQSVLRQPRDELPIRKNGSGQAKQ